MIVEKPPDVLQMFYGTSNIGYYYSGIADMNDHYTYKGSPQPLVKNTHTLLQEQKTQ
jgi:hypothetical protein